MTKRKHYEAFDVETSEEAIKNIEKSNKFVKDSKIIYKKKVFDNRLQAENALFQRAEALIKEDVSPILISKYKLIRVHEMKIKRLKKRVTNAKKELQAFKTEIDKNPEKHCSEKLSKDEMTKQIFKFLFSDQTIDLKDESQAQLTKLESELLMALGDYNMWKEMNEEKGKNECKFIAVQLK